MSGEFVAGPMVLRGVRRYILEVWCLVSAVGWPNLPDSLTRMKHMTPRSLTPSRRAGSLLLHTTAPSFSPATLLSLHRSSAVVSRRWSTFNNGLVEGFPGAVGNTPLIKLRGLSEETGCEILGKAEFMKYYATLSPPLFIND